MPRGTSGVLEADADVRSGKEMKRPRYALLQGSAAPAPGGGCSLRLHIPALFSLAVAQPGAKYLLASSFLLPQYNEVLSWAELPVLLGPGAGK